MKISIWRQFSSNHSADFTLVGEFATAEQAALRLLFYPFNFSPFSTSDGLKCFTRPPHMHT